MLAMEYGTVGLGSQLHKYASSTLSAETISESCGSRNNRIRTIRLLRPTHGPLPPPGLNYRHGPSLGFSIRGGREHGTGIFVSHVDLGSEAYTQGLRAGDQIIRVNGFAVDDAIHKEVIQLISNHTHLTLKVRGVGMIPVKDRKTDSLSWHIITDAGSPTRGSPPLGDKLNDIRINIMVAPKSKLGCGICKGPDWKPGIFVQFTKDGGIARDAGLRPGDQILYCNNVDFSDIQFNEAVSLMKSCRQLNLIVRKGAGSELFPGESSGYNSSASSVTGDQSPSWSDSKRLSIVKEENLDLGERLNHLDKFKNYANVKKWNSWDEEPEDKPLFKPTIINLTETGTTIHNNGSDEPIIEEYSTINYKTTEDIYAVSEKQKVVVDVHREMDKSDNGHLVLKKSSSTSSFCSLASKSSCTSSIASGVTSCSLSSAITMEIQRRQKKLAAQKPSIDEQLQKTKILKGVDADKQFQHSKLMDEFKKAHRKMFKNNDDATESSTSSDDRLNNNQPNNTNELSQKLSERLTDLQNDITDGVNKLKMGKVNGVNGDVSTPPPPPLPPQETSTTPSTPTSSSPSTRSNTLKSTKPKAPPVPVKYSSLSIQSKYNPPPCPSPDYDTLSLASTTSSTKPSQESAEMESIESFKINHPANVRPKPPHTFFQKRVLSNQSNVSTIRRSRPLSVTIGEYPTLRRQPGRLNFLQNGHEGKDLTSELTQTLNRSNLKKRTESMEDLLSDKSSSQGNGVRISLSNLSKAFAKSTNDLTEDFSVTVNIKPDGPNGILKNSEQSSVSVHKVLNSQKSITFGEMPTLTKGKPTKS